MSFAANLDEKVDGLFGHVDRTPSRRAAPAERLAVAKVPRPVAVARPGLIDLSVAPSSMEMRAKQWSGR